MQGPVVSRVEIAGLPMMSYAVSSPSMDDADLSWFVDNVVSRSLLQSRGVSQVRRSEEHTSELQSLMRISYAVFCLKKKKKYRRQPITTHAKSPERYHASHLK